MIIRLTDELCGAYVEVKTEEVTGDELIPVLKGALVAYGFHPDTVDGMFNEEFVWAEKISINDGCQGDPDIDTSEQDMLLGKQIKRNSKCRKK